MPIPRRQCRIAINVQAPFPGGVLDVFTGQNAETVRANGTRFEFGFFNANGRPRDISNVASLNMKLMDTQISEVVLADQTLAAEDLDLTLNRDSWEDESSQHAVFSFSNAEMNINPAGKKRMLWLVVTAILDSGVEVTLGAGDFFLHEDNNAAADPPPENPGTAITLEEADARYILLDDSTAAGRDFLDAADLTAQRLLLGITTYADLTAANAVLAAGQIYFDTALGTLNTATA